MKCLVFYDFLLSIERDRIILSPDSSFNKINEKVNTSQLLAYSATNSGAIKKIVSRRRCRSRENAKSNEDAGLKRDSRRDTIPERIACLFPPNIFEKHPGRYSISGANLNCAEENQRWAIKQRKIICKNIAVMLTTR